MLYPVYVHQGDDHHAHSASVPDFPGCYSAADDWDELPSKVQEAVELYMEGEDLDIPEASPLSAMLAFEASGDYEGGIWVMIDLDVDKLDTRKERINLSVPRNALREIDVFASTHNMNRSRFMVDAALKMARSA